MSIIISAVVSGDMLASCGHAYGVAVGTCSPWGRYMFMVEWYADIGMIS